jgi:hypothetical protein
MFKLRVTSLCFHFQFSNNCANLVWYFYSNVKINVDLCKTNACSKTETEFHNETAFCCTNLKWTECNLHPTEANIADHKNPDRIHISMLWTATESFMKHRELEDNFKLTTSFISTVIKHYF